MRLEQKYMEDLREEKINSTNYFLNKIINDKKDTVATVLYKNGSYWLYHKNTIEEQESEKGAPGEKLWYIVKYLMKDQEHNLTHGVQITLGATLKFGRVRYKIVQIHNKKGN